jgi:hypothetical protein
VACERPDAHSNPAMANRAMCRKSEPSRDSVMGALAAASAVARNCESEQPNGVWLGAVSAPDRSCQRRTRNSGGVAPATSQSSQGLRAASPGAVLGQTAKVPY